MAPSPLVEAWQALGTHETVRNERVFVVDAPAFGAASGPPLLVVHGFPTSSIDFAEALPALRSNRRVLLLDLPGFGLSDKADRPYSLFDQAGVVEEVAAGHGLDEADLLTHDMGDSVGGELLARSLEGRLGFGIRRRVLTNGSIYLGLAHLTDGQQLLASLPDELMAPELAPTRDALVSALLATMAPGTTATDGLTAAAELVVREDGNRLLPRLIRYLAERREHEDRWTGAIESHPSPLTVVWGDLDPIAVWAMTDRLLERRPDATRTRLGGVGHFPMLEAAPAYAPAVLAGL
jgi:pimeloyl-ACP methyl ester carboxylesterase